MSKLTHAHNIQRIPAEILEMAGLLPNTHFEFTYDGESVRIIPRGGGGRGTRIVASLLGRGDVRLTTDQIMAMTRDD